MNAVPRAPFKFLDPYTRADRDLFFGRDREIDELYARLLASGLLLVYGVSGCGKTSLVQCGLADRFEAADCLPLTVRRGPNILASLDAELARPALTPFAPGASLAQRVRSLYLDHFKPLHLIFDQFEEVFIFGDREERQAFGQALRELAALAPDVRLIFVVREEYLAALTEFEPFLPALFRHRVRIERMDRYLAQEAIEGPCRECGIPLEPGLAAAVLNRLAPAAATVELTWLQVVMDRLYRQAAERDPAAPALTQAGLAALGPLDNVLGRFLEEQLSALPQPQAGEAVLKALVSGDGTRRPLTLEAIADSATVRALGLGGDDLRALIERLIGARILTDRDAHDCYELRHDSLAHKVWERMTVREKELEELRQTLAVRYRDYQRRGLLLDAELLKVLPAYEDGLLLPPAQAAFVTASRQAMTRRRRRQLAWAFGLLGLVLAVVSGLALVAVQKAREAERQKDIALDAIAQRTYETVDRLAKVAGTSQALGALIQSNIDLLDRLLALAPDDARTRYHQVANLQRAADAWMELGDTGQAKATIERLQEITRARAAADPGNREWQRDLAVSHYWLGNLALALGNTAAARQEFRQYLAIAERLAAADPGNRQWQRDLSISHERLGDLALTLGDTAVAREHFQQRLAIMERLAAADPGNSEWQRDLSVSHRKLGDLALALGDTAAARVAYRQDLAIAERLAAADPGNRQWQRDLSISHVKLGDLALALGDTAAAREAYRQALAIAERLAAADPGNSEWQRDLTVSHNKLGNLALALGDTAAAREAYRQALAIAERLAAADPGNSQWQRDLSVSYYKLGQVELQGDAPAAALELADKAVAIAKRRAEADSANPTCQGELAETLVLRGLVHDALERLDPAAADYRDCARLAPQRANCQGALGWALIQLGRPGEARGPTAEAHRLAPDDLSWTLNLGHTYLLDGDAATAQGYYDEAVAQVPDAAAFEAGPVADFQLFIAKGWQPAASRAALARMRKAFARRGDAKAETPAPPASPRSEDLR